MEAVGLTVGIVGLAGLCSACLDAFGLISTAKAFSIEYEISSIKLDIEKTKLLHWAEGVGLLATDPRERSSALNRSHISNRSKELSAPLLSF